MRRLSIEGISAEHLAAEVLGAYAFANERGRAPVGVRAFNPTLHDEGYEPLGSVVETNTDDWPFLVDSVSAALERRGEHVARLVHPIIGISREDGHIASVSHARNAIHRESVMHFDLTRKLTDRELEELERGHRVGPARRAQHRHRLRRDDAARGGDDRARAQGEQPLRQRRGARGGRLPRLAAARQLRPAGGARVRDPRRRLSLCPRLGPGHPGRRGALGLRAARSAVAAQRAPAHAGDVRRAADRRQGQRARARSTATSGWTTWACGG